MSNATTQYHSLTLLTRLADQRKERRGWLEPALLGRIDELAEIALDVARETGGPLGRVLTRVISLRGSTVLAEKLLQQLDHIEYRHSIHLHEIALICSCKVLAAKGRDHPSRKPEDRAAIGIIKRNLAVWIAGLGQRKRAVAINQEAASIFRDLIRNNPSFRVDLAITLNNLGIQLGAVGHWEEAGQALAEALRLYEQQDGEEYLAALAADNFATVLEKTGRGGQALDLTREAVRRMQIWEKDLPVLARGPIGQMQTNLGVHLRNQGDLEGARQALLKAQQLLERLSEARPDLYLPVMAWSLKDFSAILYELNQTDEAIQVAQNALSLVHKFRRKHPTAVNSLIAGIYHNLAAFLWASGRRQEALLQLQEAIRERRQLAKTDFLAFGLPLVDSLQNLSLFQLRLGSRAEGTTTARECVALLRQLAETSPAIFLSHLGRLLTTLMFHFRDAGHLNEAVDFLRQAIETFRQLVQTGDELWSLELARGLNELGIFVGQEGSFSAAAEAGRESVEIYRRLVGKDSSLDRELAMALQNLAVWTLAAECYEESLEAARETLDTLLRATGSPSADAAAQIVEAVELQWKALNSLDRSSEVRHLCATILRRLPARPPDAGEPLARARREILRIRRAVSRNP